MMNIEELVNKYFEGETSCQEERELRRYFTEGIIPKHLEMYRPLFAYLDEEAKRAQPETKIRHSKLRRNLFYALSGVAAGVALLWSISGIHKQLHVTPENYVIIDGKCYTDENLIREEAMTALQNVSFTEDELLNNLLNK